MTGPACAGSPSGIGSARVRPTVGSAFGAPWRGRAVDRLGLRRALIPSLVPLVVSAFMSSEERALALESKGFEYECEKTTLIDVLPNQCEKYAWAGIGLYVILVIGGVVLWIL